MRDGSDGAALLAVVHYYCPEHMKLDGECRAPLSHPCPWCPLGRSCVETVGGEVRSVDGTCSGHVVQAQGWVSTLRSLFLLCN